MGVLKGGRLSLCLACDFFRMKPNSPLTASFGLQLEGERIYTGKVSLSQIPLCSFLVSYGMYDNDNNDDDHDDIEDSGSLKKMKGCDDISCESK